MSKAHLILYFIRSVTFSLFKFLFFLFFIDNTNGNLTYILDYSNIIYFLVK